MAGPGLKFGEHGCSLAGGTSTGGLQAPITGFRYAGIEPGDDGGLAGAART